MRQISLRRLLTGFGLAVAALAVSQPSARADDASTAWRRVLSKCAKSDVIGTQSLFFGLSNTVGPGSVWRFAEDKSVRLLFELSDAFPKAADQSKMVVKNNVASCSGNSSSGWNLGVGLPFSTGLLPLSADLEGSLKGANRVIVSVNGYAVDELKETPWKSAFRKLGARNDYAHELAQPNRVIAENVVKISGLRATFVFGTKLSAVVRAKFQNKIVSIGDANLHGDVSAENAITLTADGPFYMLAAYSKLVAGTPIGLDDLSVAPIVLLPANVPAGATLKGDREPQ